ncbi:MAG: hypothetical protein ACT4OJ_06755 [Bacteroidota bacterium]
MEVHAHTHTARKKWTHYFWEFLMLFLAVFCGFLAEYQLEHKIEKDREKQFIRSFYEDLTADENDLQAIAGHLNTQAWKADSLQLLMKDILVTQPANSIYVYLREIVRSSPTLFYPNDRTIVQLRNSGGMRLIKNKNVSDSMVGYYRAIEIIQFLSEDVLASKRRFRELYTPLLNAEDFIKTVDRESNVVNPAETLYLRKTDEDIINMCRIELNRLESISGNLANRVLQLKAKAGRIKDFVQKEYHLE